MAKNKHSTALFEVINRPTKAASVPPPAVVTRAPANIPTPGEEGEGVRVDGDRHLILMRLSYTTAAVGAFTVLVVVALAYLLGRGNAPKLANASTEELKQGPAHPSVLNVTAPQQTETPPLKLTSPTTPQGPVGAPTNVTRLLGQNYVIMQSYPDEAAAKEAQGVLLAAGIPCTIEKGPAGFVPMSWYSVIGTKAFDHITRNHEYDAYIKSVVSVNAGEKSKFKKLDPRPYRWK